MTDIDWSKAPEGAQYYSASDDGFYTFYREIKESTYEIFYCGGTRWVLRVGTPEENYTIIPRPDKAWNGEGLPPVGTVCEMHHDAWQPNNWPKVTVKYASAEYFITEDGAGEQHWHAHSVKFRPIRTIEQVAADERDESVISVFRLIKENGWDIQSDDADYLYFLYDSGLLKKAS